MESADTEVAVTNTLTNANSHEKAADVSNNLLEDPQRSPPSTSSADLMQESTPLDKQIPPEKEIETSDKEPVLADTINETGDSKNPPTPDLQQTEKIKSRELKSLIAAAKESNLDTNIAHKRKSTPEQPSVSSRRSSTCSIDKETLSASKRNMRSQNPEFVAKHQKFISKITSDFLGVEIETGTEMEDGKKDTSINKRKREGAALNSPLEDKKMRKLSKPDSSVMLKPGKDIYCWQCHKEGIQIQCFVCPRGYHMRCFKHTSHICGNWECVECETIVKAESPDTRSFAMRQLDQTKIRFVLNFALKRMLELNGTEPFVTPVDTKELSDYRNYVVHPMDLTQLQKNIEQNQYTSTESFLADTKWILHNSIVYNSSQSKLTTVAKAIVKTCKLEMAEIETCPQCYINANTQKDTWFIEACSKPHILVWAKLKGFPFWPAKAVNTNDCGMVDVRFFGAHDKAWVPVKDVFLYSDKDPNIVNKNQKNNIAESIKEVDLHIENLIAKFGEFHHADLRIPFEPENAMAQIQMMLPTYRPSKATIDAVSKSMMYKQTPKKINKPDTIKKRTLSLKSNLDIWDEGGGAEDETSEEEELRSPVSSTASNKTTKTNSDVSQDLENDKPDEQLNTSEESDKNGKNALLVRGKVRTRGGYPNVTGKLRILSGVELENVKNLQSVEIQNSPSVKKRRDSDISSSGRSDTSRLSEKGQVSENLVLELKIDKTDHQIKTSDETTGNDESETSPNQLKPLRSMADKIMKKITKCDAATGKKILENIAATDNVRQIASPTSDSPLKSAKQDEGEKSENTKCSDSSPNSTTRSSCSSKFVVHQIESDYEPETESDDLSSTSDCEELNERVKPKSKTKRNSNVTIVDVKKIILGGNGLEVKKNEINEDDQKVMKDIPKPDDKSSSLKSNGTVDKKIVEKEPDVDKATQETETKSDSVSSNSTNVKENTPVPDIDIKEEVLDSDEEALNADGSSRQDLFPALNLSPNVTLSVIDKQNVIEIKKKKSAEPVALIGSYNELSERQKLSENPNNVTSTKTTDNISKIIENVVKGVDLAAQSQQQPKKAELKVISVAEINQKKQSSIGNTIVMLNNSKQRARKSFPNKATFIHSKKTQKDKSVTFGSKFETINTVPQKPPETTAKKSFDTNEKVLHMPHTTQPVTILPPNISFNSVHNASNNIFTMFSQNGGQQKMSVCIPQNLFTHVGGASKSVPIIPISTTPAPQLNATTVSSGAAVVNSRSAQTEEERNTAEGLPPLKRRPSGPLGRDLHSDYAPPCSIGPVTQLLNRSAQQLTDFFRGLLIESLGDLSTMGSLEAKVKELQLEIEVQKQKHLEEVNALKLEVASLKQAQMVERQRLIQETRQAAEQDRIRAVDDAKSKQWCAMCLKESQYRCCWSTSYCSYACQKSHWSQHQTKCQQGLETNAHPSNENLNSTHNSETDTITTNPIIKPIKAFTTVAKHKQITKSVVANKSGGKNTISIVSSKAGTSSVPTLTFVQNTAGNIELVGNHGPIALGGKLITASALPSKIKGYLVSSSAVTNLSPTPSLASLSNKSLTIATTNTPAQININSTKSNVSPSHDDSNEIMEVDDE